MQKPANIGENSQGRTLYVGIGLVLTLLLVGYLVYRIASIILVLLLTMLFSIILSGPVGYLNRRGLGRGWATLIVLGGTAFVLYLTGLAVAPVVQRQSMELAEQVPTLLEEVQKLLAGLQSSLGVDLGVQLQPANLFERVRGFLSGDLFAVAANIGGSLANGLSLAFVALIATVYLVLNPQPLVGGVVAFFPAGWRPRVREILNKMYEAVQRWFLGQLTSMTLIGVLSAIALSIIGIPFAVLIGLISGLISFIPFVGPVISVVPPVILGLVSPEPFDAVWVLLAYGAIQLLESNIIQPVVMSRAVSLHPAMIVFSLLIMGTLFGFVGLLLAVPLVAALHVLVLELWIKRMDRTGIDPDPPPKEEVAVVKTDSRQRARRMLRAARDLLRRS